MGSPTTDFQRFLMIKESKQKLAARQINIVLNRFEDLKRRVPTEKIDEFEILQLA